jgi:RHS repeat-associated protein
MTTAAICATREVSWCPSFYRGEQYDSDLALYYLRARYYNPNTGRFMSRDPEDGKTTDPATLHKYLYADGDPVNMRDPMGHEALFENALIQGGSKLGVMDYILSKAGLVVAGCFYGVARAIYAIAHDQSFWPGADGVMALIGCATGWPLPPVT